MLSAKQRKAIELMMLGTMTQEKIAAEIGVTSKTIWMWKNNDDFMAELQRVNRLALRSLAAKATKVIGDSLTSNQEWIAFQAARDILDRSGYKGEDLIKIEGAVPVTIIEDITE